MTRKLCHKIENVGYGFPIKLYQTGIDQFDVQYGKQLKTRLNYSEAAHEYGACIMHALACAGNLDNREKGETS